MWMWMYHVSCGWLWFDWSSVYHRVELASPSCASSLAAAKSRMVWHSGTGLHWHQEHLHLTKSSLTAAVSSLHHCRTVTSWHWRLTVVVGCSYNGRCLLHEYFNVVEQCMPSLMHMTLIRMYIGLGCLPFWVWLSKRQNFSEYFVPKIIRSGSGLWMCGVKLNERKTRNSAIPDKPAWWLSCLSSY